MFKNYLKNLLLMIISVTLCLYFAELMLGFYLVKSVLRYPVPPFSDQIHTTVDYNVRYHYNNISLRGSDYEPHRLYDLALLGDSFLFGQGVDDDTTLQKELEKRGYSVLNISEIATNPIDYFHKLKVMQSMGLKAKNIIIGLCMGNDFQGIGDKRIEKALFYHYRDNFLNYNLRGFLKLERLRYRIRSLIYRFSDKINAMFFSRHQERIVVHDFERAKAFDSDWLKFFTNNNEEMIKAMRGQGQTPIVTGQIKEDEYLKKMQMDDASVEKTVIIIRAIANSAQTSRVYLLLIPDRYYIYGLRSKKYESSVRRLVDDIKGSVNVIDLHDAFSPADHFPHDGHWNVRGHQLAARIISGRIEAHH